MFFESVNVVQENSDEVSTSVCTIDERKYSSLRKLLRVTAYCLKFIKKRVWNRCSDEVKKRICNRYRILNIINDLRDSLSDLRDSFTLAFTLRTSDLPDCFGYIYCTTKTICRCILCYSQEATEWIKKTAWLDAK